MVANSTKIISHDVQVVFLKASSYILAHLYTRDNIKSIFVKDEYEPCHDKTYQLVFRQIPTKTGLYVYKRWLNAYSFGFRKKRDSIINVGKTKALISCTVTAQQVCTINSASMQKAGLLLTRLKISCRIILGNACQSKETEKGLNIYLWLIYHRSES